MQAKVSDITAIMERMFPLTLAQVWDNPGLQIGSRENPVSRVLLALDLDRHILAAALDMGAEMIITHHPLLFTPLKGIDLETPLGRLVADIIAARINVYSAHTNFDAGERGMSQVLAEKVGLQEIELLDIAHSQSLLKLVVFVPEEHEQVVRRALLEAGAGHIGGYSDCSFRSKGIGTFRPLPGSNPFIGRQGVVEETDEYRLETVIPEERLPQAMQALRESHPYEEIAYDLYRLQNQGHNFSLGRVGKLANPIPLGDFCQQVKNCLQEENVRVTGELDRVISSVAVVGGSGADFMFQAKSRGCDALLTGDLKYHEARAALDLDLAVIDAGHQGTEKLFGEYLAELLTAVADESGFKVEFAYRLNSPCQRTI